METKYCIYEKKDHIAYVTMNRPEVGNALHGPADEEMREVWLDYMNDDNLWVAIVTGVGEKFFSTGHDLKAHDQAIKEKKTGSGSPFGKAGFGGLCHLECLKPVIAAVNGYALAGGFELLLACDIIVAAEHAQFGLPEGRVGLTSTGGGAQRLTHQIPWRHAMAILLTGKRFSAQQMLEWGLINEVVPLKDLMPTAERWAHEILEASPMANWAMKHTALQSIGMPDKEAMALKVPWTDKSMLSEDRKEGVRAFIERRKPQWKLK